MASVVIQTLNHFRINKATVGYFVLDNASNNNAAVKAIAQQIGFNAVNRRLRCAPYTLNLVSQILL
jgi:hypothetical protein